MKFNKKNLLKKPKKTCTIDSVFSWPLQCVAKQFIAVANTVWKAMHKRGLACPLRGSFSATYHIHLGHLCPLSSCSTWSKSLCTVTLLQNHTANANWDCCSFHEELKTAACQPDVKKSHMKYGGGVCFLQVDLLCTSSQCVQIETMFPTDSYLQLF